MHGQWLQLFYRANREQFITKILWLTPMTYPYLNISERTDEKTLTSAWPNELKLQVQYSTRLDYGLNAIIEGRW